MLTLKRQKAEANLISNSKKSKQTNKRNDKKNERKSSKKIIINNKQEERQTVAPQKVCNACVWHKSKLDNFGKGKHKLRNILQKKIKLKKLDCNDKHWKYPVNVHKHNDFKFKWELFSYKAILKYASLKISVGANLLYNRFVIVCLSICRKSEIFVKVKKMY